MDIYETKAIWFEEDELQPVPPNAQYILNLQESIAGLLAALERVETDAEGYCLWCYRCVALPMVDHSPGCLRKIALARAKGE